MCATVRDARAPGVTQGVLLLLPCTLAVMGIVVLLPVLPALMAHYHAVPGHQYLIQGGVLTMPALCIALFSPLAGWVADRVGRRRLLLSSMVLYAFVGVAPTVLDTLPAIIASRVGVGLCEAVIMTVSTTMISDYFTGHSREKWLAAQTAVASVSALGLIALGGFLGEALGWRGPFWVYGCSLPLAIAIAAFTWEPSASQTNKAPKHRSSADQADTSFPWRRITCIGVITLYASILFYTNQTQTSLALSAEGVSDPARLGTYVAVATLGVPIGTLVFQRLSTLNVSILLFIEFLTIGIGFICMGNAHIPEVYVSAAFLNQLGCGMILPTLLTWATRGLAYHIRGRGTGIWQSLFAIGQFLSGVVVTLLAESAGGLLSAFGILGISSIIVSGLSAMSIRLQPNET